MISFVMIARCENETIMKEKQSNLCLSADLTSLDEIIEVKNFID